MKKFGQYFMFSVLSAVVSSSFASPTLNFSDLISGPDTGLGDGLGSGVVVTIWGQGLGSSQSGSSITFTDSAGSTSTPAHIYYWKNADGQLPGGPADLNSSHSMQEIAFSIPNMASGGGTIQVKVNNETSNTLPFTIRSGGIYHVKSSGSDSSGSGTFSSPWKTINQAFDDIDNPGGTIYVHNSIATGSSTDHKAVYWNDASASSGLSNQFGVVAFPNSQPVVTGYSGFRNYNTAGQVVSKFDIYASECDEGPNGQPTNCASSPSLNITYGIQASAFGRAVGNAITDQPGGCADGTQAAISGNALNGNDRVSAYQILGNEIYDYGCAGSNKLHHTTYLSIRSGDDNLQVPPWRFGWNYLHDNHTKNGIHQFDENNKGSLCGSPAGTVIINDNVIINQSGAGINIGANCPWTNDFDVYNNVLVNVGLALDWDGSNPATSNGPNTSGISISDNKLMGTVNIFNNTIRDWNTDDPVSDTQACLGLQGSGDNVIINWSNNVCETAKDKPFVAAGCCGANVQLDNVSGSNNVWFFDGSSPQLAVKPTWDSSGITADPLIAISGAKLVVQINSPLIGQASSNLSHDVYGAARQPGGEIGAIEYFTNQSPKSPSNITVQ